MNSAPMNSLPPNPEAPEQALGRPRQAIFWDIAISRRGSGGDFVDQRHFARQHQSPDVDNNQHALADRANGM